MHELPEALKDPECLLVGSYNPAAPLSPGATRFAHSLGAMKPHVHKATIYISQANAPVTT